MHIITDNFNTQYHRGLPLLEPWRKTDVFVLKEIHIAQNKAKTTKLGA